MHQKKSQVVQIGKESSGISSDFNPFSCSSLTPPQVTTSTFTTTTTATAQSSSSSSSSSVPYKRPLLTQTTSSLSKSPTLYNLAPTPHFPSKTTASNNRNNRNVTTSSFSTTFQLPAIRGLRLHVTVSIFSFVLFYLIIISRPNNPALLDYLSAITAIAAAVAAATVLISLQLALPRLPAIRPFLNCPCSRLRRRPLPVFWAAGGRNPGSGGGGDGLRVQVYSNGDVYQGEFRKGKSWGSGVYYYSMSGGRYEGDWVDGKYEGFGVETWARGSRYRGQFRIGLRHGFGVYRFYTGDVYAGEWASGQSHGCGVHTCDDGSKFVGEFKWGVKHGLGHYHFRNGDTYAGEYFADKMHGFGVYRFANGHLYEGAWHEGKRQGLGMYTFGNGETQSGHWQNGVLHIPSTQNASYPVSPVGVNHSKVLNAVQEARRAAEKAYDVAKVDERVNRAVAAANRAANAARVAAVKAMQKQMHHNVHSESIAIPVV